MSSQGRSVAMSAGVLGAVAIALICAFSMSALSSKSDYGNFDATLSQIYRDPGPTSVHTVMVIAGLGLALMALAALGAGSSAASTGTGMGDPRTRASIVTCGALMALTLPAYLQYKISDALSQAGNSGSGVSASIGTGMILAGIAVIIGAVVAWAAAVGPADGGQATGSTLTAEIERLDAMRRGGALTDEEFQAAKARLLNA